MQLEEAQVFCRRGVGRPAEEGRKCPHVSHIVAARPLIEAMHGHVFNHARPQWADGRLGGIGGHQGFLSRAEGCWTFDARDQMPRPSRATAHHPRRNCPNTTRAPSRASGLILRRVSPVAVRSGDGRLPDHRAGAQPHRQGTGLRAPRAVPRLICKFEDIDGAASTHRRLRLLFAHPSIGGADHYPFHVPGTGAASCRRSNLGPAIGCSGAHFVSPGSPMRPAHSSAETGTVSISPVRATSISHPVGDAGRLRVATARRNFAIAQNFSTRATSTPWRRWSPLMSRKCRTYLGTSWMLARGPVITSPE